MIVFCRYVMLRRHQYRAIERATVMNAIASAQSAIAFERLGVAAPISQSPTNRNHTPTVTRWKTRLSSSEVG